MSDTTIKERFLVTIDDTEYDLNLSRQGDSCFVELNGDKYEVSFDKLSGQKFLFRLNDNSSEIGITRNNGTLSMFLDGSELDARVESYSLAELRKKAGTSSEGQGAKIVLAPMPGLVLQSEVEVGDEVKKGDPLIIIEAMKMENIIKATSAGTVKTIFVSDGEAVEKNHNLIEFE
ncbi:MAG: acetyl-CoA carboxylase biotin carboxyl carrier protein subunit [candidate division Zixibacteria bacterium]|nr:acetyl-CoA carboxylase biotin carboxyl carrier protein subunit [candidate division Zixibacteria bacterium]